MKPLQKQLQTAKNRIIIVTGMNGVGKDYLVDKANKKHKMTAIGWGDLLGEELGANKDFMMSTLPPGRIMAGQFAVCGRVLEMQPLIAICHVVKPDEDGRYIYNLEIERRLNPLCYVFVSAPAELIDKRVRQRNKIGGRRSTELSVEEIDRIQKIRLDAVRELAEIQKAELIVLNNTDEELDYNLHQLSKLIVNLKNKGVS